jgi:hypothetical protein
MMNIELANGKIAVYKSTRKTKVPDLMIEEEVDIHTYHVPCPVCDHSENNLGFSRDGVFFINNQIVCRHCGVFFRPVVDQKFVAYQLFLRDIAEKKE